MGLYFLVVGSRIDLAQSEAEEVVLVIALVLFAVLKVMTEELFALWNQEAQWHHCCRGSMGKWNREVYVVFYDQTYCLILNICATIENELSDDAKCSTPVD